MNTLSRTIAGVVALIFGVYMIISMIIEKPEGWYWIVAYGVFFIVIGLFIFFNKKEDDIEEIKNNKDK